ncbi:MAG: PEP/pyruvate-binding domain-containing protein, partial [Planctomycetota bacterium]|nr:PEP/pyruvate-binding domain-containing protein [Planctomycetota bacterium]
SGEGADGETSPTGPPPWETLLEFLGRTDQNLLLRITRKMIAHLCWRGVTEANELFERCLQRGGAREGAMLAPNHRARRHPLHDKPELTRLAFELATRHFSQSEVIACIQAWINEERSTSLIESLETPGAGLAEMAAAIERYQSAAIDETELPPAVQTGLKVALLRRYFVDQLAFLSVARRFVEIRDFYDLIRRLIHPSRSQGRIGGKGAGLFLASRIVRHPGPANGALRDLKTPATWYVISDTLLDFVHYNNLDEVYNRKYMEIERIRQDYPHIVQLFRNAVFPPEVVKGLAAALDDFRDRPLIVRSSSLLEDRFESAFSDQYKSIFLPNQGSKEQRLDALQRAIAEVYASIYSPDPIAYRAARGLLDYREEMGVLIQEVVGQRIGRYFMPAFSGVALSRLEHPWSKRLRREDGLVRLVPGLGRRAADRLGPEAPVRFSPGQPDVPGFEAPEEIVRCAPRSIDVINLETNAVETVDVRVLLRGFGEKYPLARSMVSIVDGDRVRPPTGLEPSWGEDELAITFQGLIDDPSFVSCVRALLEVLGEHLASPVELEFAHDGTDLYLLECRPQIPADDQPSGATPG